MKAIFPCLLSLLLLCSLICKNEVICVWIDRDTPESKFVIDPFANRNSDTSDRSRVYSLIFSDEFNEDERRFDDGYDPRWTAIHKNDYTNYALHYYNRDLVTTSNGYLNISTVMKDIVYEVKNDYAHAKSAKSKKVTRTEKKFYQSGMIQGWNKFCFTGGIVELSVKLPGRGQIGGLWPAVWLLGNLARATYVASSDNIWPWSFDECISDVQSKQQISACNAVNHFDLHNFKGRGAPEIDIFEVMPGPTSEALINTNIRKPYLSSSYQVAPAIKDYRPQSGNVPNLSQWYNEGLEYGTNTSLNIFFYGMDLEGQSKQKSYTADAISANTNIDDSYFDDFHTYRLEWMPPSASAGKGGGERAKAPKAKANRTAAGGYLKWYIDGELVYSIESNALIQTGSLIPEEPMYLIINTAISSTWGFPIPCPEGCNCNCLDANNDDCACALPAGMKSIFPANMLIDYVRVYQDNSDDRQSVGCSTKRFPSAKFIEAHKDRYMESAEVDNPLLFVPTGGAACKADRDCGNMFVARSGSNDIHEKDSSETLAVMSHKGRCIAHACVCNSGFTGPSCKVSSGFDDNTDGDEDLLHIHGIMVPNLIKVFALVILVGLVIVVVRGASGSDTANLQGSTSRGSNHNMNNNINNNSNSNISRIRDLSRGPYQALSRTEN